MTFCCTHLGCKVNEYEIRYAASKFASAGFVKVPFSVGSADIVIINTCCVTTESEAKSRKVINRARRQNQNAFIALTGCFTQMFPETAKNCGNPDLIIPNSQKENIFGLVCNELIKRGVINEIPTPENKVYLYSDRTRADVKIQDGCDNFCSYCIIPYARGGLKTRPKPEIITEVKELALEGCKEIVLTGIHLTRYGVDAPQNGDLAALCQELSKIEGIERIRLGSLEPSYITEERAKILSESKVCPHFHLALQSGSDTVLSRMNRKYKTDVYENEAHILRKYFKNCALTTDIMVGFPGETEEEFEESVNFVKKLNFCKLHVFPYSKRPGTPAYDMKQVEDKIKKQRTDIMLRVADEAQTEFIKANIGKTFNVLFERKKNGVNMGHTENYITVFVESRENLTNTIRKIIITEADESICYGTFAGENNE